MLSSRTKKELVSYRNTPMEVLFCQTYRNCLTINKDTKLKDQIRTNHCLRMNLNRTLKNSKMT